jgi:hypothetical protein
MWRAVTLVCLAAIGGCVLPAASRGGLVARDPSAQTGHSHTSGRGRTTVAAPSARAAEPSRAGKGSSVFEPMLEALEAERQASAVPRRMVRPAAKPGEEVVALGWAGESRLLVVIGEGGEKLALQCEDLEHRPEGGWSAPLPALRGDHVYAFREEDTERPVLMAWSTARRARLEWAIRIDLGARRPTALKSAELTALRERVRRLSRAPMSDEFPPEAERHTLVVVDGEGEVRRKVALPSSLYYYVPDSGREVAEGHRPALFLYWTSDGALVLDPLDEHSDWDPVMSVPVTSGRPGGGIGGPPAGLTERWSFECGAAEASVSSDASAVAFVRQTEASSRAEGSEGEPSRASDLALYELRAAAPRHFYALVDVAFFLDDAARWTEPSDAAPRRPEVHLPSLSPRGTRVAYLKDGAVWVADLGTPGAPRG